MRSLRTQRCRGQAIIRATGPSVCVSRSNLFRRYVRWRKPICTEVEKTACKSSKHLPVSSERHRLSYCWPNVEVRIVTNGMNCGCIESADRRDVIHDAKCDGVREHRHPLIDCLLYA